RGDGDVPFLADRRPLVQLGVADVRGRGRQIADLIRAVVDDDQLLVRVVLAVEVPDGLGYERPSVVRRHDAGHERGAVADRAPPTCSAADCRPRARQPTWTHGSVPTSSSGTCTRVEPPLRRLSWAEAAPRKPATVPGTWARNGRRPDGTPTAS